MKRDPGIHSRHSEAGRECSRCGRNDDDDRAALHPSTFPISDFLTRRRTPYYTCYADLWPVGRFRRTGEGAYLHTTDGRKFLDFTSGIAVTALGHCHPHVIEAVTKQANTLWHSSNLFQIPGQRSSPNGSSPTALRYRVLQTIRAPRRSNCRSKVARKIPERNRAPGEISGDCLQRLVPWP